MKRRSSGGCSSFLLLFFLVLLILKVAGAVDWSWWWVASPLWLPLAFVLVVLAVMALMGVGVYKIVVSVLRRQDFANVDKQRGDAGPDVLDAEGTEVRRPAREDGETRGLPAPRASEPRQGDDSVDSGD